MTVRGRVLERGLVPEGPTPMEAAGRRITDRAPHERTKTSTTAPTAAEMCARCGVRPATPGRLDGLCDADRMKDSRARRSA